MSGARRKKPGAGSGPAGSRQAARQNAAARFRHKTLQNLSQQAPDRPIAPVPNVPPAPTDQPDAADSRQQPE